LVVVESDFVFGRSETVLDGPARPSHAGKFPKTCAVGIIAVVESGFTVVDGSADQVLRRT
jgi:hypothetical protein